MDLAVTETAGPVLVRLTVTHSSRRVDLAAASGVPLAEILPDLVGAVGGLDAATAYGGYGLVRRDGLTLDPEKTLAEQGVEDGDTLAVHVGADDRPPKTYDDLVEAVADAVEARTRPWSPAASRRTALVACAVLFGVAAAALGSQWTSGAPVAAAAGATAVLLVAGAVVLSRALHEDEAAIVVGWCAAPFAVVAGAAAGADAPLAGVPAAYAGTALLLGCGAVVTGVAGRATAILPAGGLGMLLAGAGAAVAVGVRPAAAYAVGMSAAVLLGAALPRLAFAVTQLRAPQPHSDEELLVDPPPIDAEAVAGSVIRGRALSRAIVSTLAMITAVAAPFAVALGLAGALLVVAAVAAIVVGTRRYRDAVLVWSAMAGAVVTTGVAGIAVIVLHPAWRFGLVVVLLVIGTLLLAVAALPRGASVRFGRAVEILEGIALSSLLPLTIVAVVTG